MPTQHPNSHVHKSAEKLMQVNVRARIGTRGGPKVTETVTYIRYCLPERVPRTVFITSIAGVVVGIEKAAQNDASGP